MNILFYEIDSESEYVTVPLVFTSSEKFQYEIKERSSVITKGDFYESSISIPIKMDSISSEDIKLLEKYNDEQNPIMIIFKNKVEKYGACILEA